MQLSKNKIIIACAGSGKTTYIVEEALKLKDKKVLVITYTNENLDQIRSFFIDKSGYIPANITVQSWFSCLLQEGVRPYQNYKTERKRIRSIYYFKKEDAELIKKLRYIKEENDSHYLTKNNYLYEDKVSQFFYKCNELSKGLVLKRLGKIYDYLFIDEAQDLEGWDYDLIGNLFDSSLSIVLVGDPRQKILKTHRHLKNKGFDTVFDWLDKKKKNNYICEINNASFRCNQCICDFADKLFPHLPKTVSKNLSITGHDGIFYILDNEIDIYMKTHHPVILRYNKKADTLDFSGINIGIAKGRTYDRVLIFPTNPMLEYLKTKDISKAGDKFKLYVAITRARYSVAFVVSENI
ncbi:MAG: UvrD-helicase domain-containing protein [Sedimentisphaerales bacterium]